jgi:membrane protease YdiL (CAAX protease family)
MVRIGLILLRICASVLCWEAGVPLLLVWFMPGISEFSLVAADKLGFAGALGLVLAGRGLWRRCGFAGGLRLDRLGLLWPIGLIAAFSVVQGAAETDPWRLLGWLAVSLAIGFGEEGVFRGLIMAVFGPDRPRLAVAVSSILFGALHLSGLLAPIDYRYVLTQAVAAGCLGLVLGSARLLAGSIWPAILAHGALDFCGLIAAGSVSSAMEYSDGTLIVNLGSALVAFLWGAVLWRRLPRPGSARLAWQ